MVADSVKCVSELLANHRRAVGPVFIAFGDLPEAVILVNPIAPIGQRQCVGPLRLPPSLQTS